MGTRVLSFFQVKLSDKIYEEKPFLFRCIISANTRLFEKINKPSFIDFKVDKDSIYVISKNKLYCPLYVKAINRKSKR